MIWGLTNGHLEVTAWLFWGLCITSGMMFIILFFGWLFMPEASKIMFLNAMPGGNKILAWSADKSQDMELKALSPIGKGIYRGKKKFDIFLTPGSPYLGPEPEKPKVIGPDGEPVVNPAPAPEPTWLQKVVDSVYRIRGVGRPIFFTYSGVNLLLNPELVASLDIKLFHQLWPKKAEEGSQSKKKVDQTPSTADKLTVTLLAPLSPSQVIPSAIARRITQSQLSYVAKTYYRLGYEEAESAGGKVALIMMIVMFVVIGVMAWQAGWLG